VLAFSIPKDKMPEMAKKISDNGASDTSDKFVIQCKSRWSKSVSTLKELFIDNKRSSSAMAKPFDSEQINEIISIESESVDR